MTIAIDDTKFRQILDLAYYRQVDPEEIRAIVRIAQLAAAVDLDDDPDERTMLGTLGGKLCALGGLASVPRLARVPIDDEERAFQVAKLSLSLVSPAARDLAFAVAYLVIVADLELAPVEGSLLSQLAYALMIPEPRANQLVQGISQIVTPPEVQTAKRAPRTFAARH